MIYFSSKTFKFLKELETNNDRDWFNENKERYILDLKEPFEHFISDLIEAMQPEFETLPISPKDAIFRIYRDVRFSRDKSLYKNHVSALITPGGRKGMDQTGIYIEISADHVRIYSGLYQLDSKQLKNIRSHISHNLDEFNTLISSEPFESTFGEIRGEKNKRIQKEFEEDAVHQPLLFNKQFYYFVNWGTDVALKEGLVEKAVSTFKVAKPVSEFLHEGLY